MLENLLESDFDFIEDEIDCATLNESYDNVDSILFEEDEVVDTSLEYTNDLPHADQVSIDADDAIAAERDLVYDPLDMEEEIDTIITDDDISNIDFSEESEEEISTEVEEDIE